MTETCCNITPFHIKDENKEKLSKTIIYADEKALDALGENRKVNVELDVREKVILLEDI